MNERVVINGRNGEGGGGRKRVDQGVAEGVHDCLRTWGLNYAFVLFRAEQGEVKRERKIQSGKEQENRVLVLVCVCVCVCVCAYTPLQDNIRMFKSNQVQLYLASKTHSPIAGMTCISW